MGEHSIHCGYEPGRKASRSPDYMTNFKVFQLNPELVRTVLPGLSIEARWLYLVLKSFDYAPLEEDMPTLDEVRSTYAEDLDQIKFQSALNELYNTFVNQKPLLTRPKEG